MYVDGKEEIISKEGVVSPYDEMTQIPTVGEIENGYVVALKESSDERAKSCAREVVNIMIAS